jgi:hypothetical protein
MSVCEWVLCAVARLLETMSRSNGCEGLKREKRERERVREREKERVKQNMWHLRYYGSVCDSTASYFI